MRKMVAVAFLLFSVGCFAYMNLLTSEDWQYLDEDNKHPAITFPNSNEEYYNEWQCHSVEDLELEMVPVTYQGKKMGSPTIFTKNDKGIVEYALDPEPLKFSEIIMNKWKLLIDDVEEVCLVSSYLQDTPEGELRILQRIKTSKGIWDWFKESENYHGYQRSNL